MTKNRELIDLIITFLHLVPLVHLIALSLITSARKIRQYDTVLDSLKVGFVYNSIVLVVVASSLLQILEYKYHLPRPNWKFIVESSIHLSYWALFANLFRRCIKYHIKLSTQLKGNLISSLFLANYALMLCGKRYLIQTHSALATIFLTVFVIVVDDYSLDRWDIINKSRHQIANRTPSRSNVTEDSNGMSIQRLQKKQSTKQGLIEEAYIVNYKEVVKFEKVTLVYVIAYKNKGNQQTVERSFREFLNLYRDLRNIMGTSLIRFPQKRKGSNAFLTKREVIDRMVHLQEFLDVILNFEENEFINMFLNVEAEIVEYMGYSKKGKSRTNSSEHANKSYASSRYLQRSIPDIIWEDEKEDSHGSSKDQEDPRQDIRRNKSQYNAMFERSRIADSYQQTMD